MDRFKEKGDDLVFSKVGLIRFLRRSSFVFYTFFFTIIENVQVLWTKLLLTFIKERSINMCNVCNIFYC